MEAGAEDGGERFASGNLGQSRRDLGEISARSLCAPRMEIASTRLTS